ncbi:hypothetical protein NH287_07880 [Microbacterium sp. CnD16-F]|uniref:hypothetical protein n=1 Tax=Microbacterium sp. CnD16-F TaxID=2954493 RepID=UPI0020968830|nr:hypothetical protein [Microbacterium sp. CnD16-F]MCO7203408.1 hypothetical protein [Microbacterium sp. CnD16-F]
MPYRSRALLETWLTEFTADHALGGLAKVIPQDGTLGGDTGLIVFPLGGGTTSVYIEPVAVGDRRWRIHFEPREQEAVMSSAQVHTMAAELEMSAALCDFIETKSAAHLAGVHSN